MYISIASKTGVGFGHLFFVILNWPQVKKRVDFAYFPLEILHV
jgi:hypothetical protein